MLNLLSLTMGLVSWALGLGAILRKRFGLCSFLSLSFAGGALAAQFFEINRRVRLEDWSALLDTSDALAEAALILLSVTAVLNGIALLRSRKR